MDYWDPWSDAWNLHTEWRSFLCTTSPHFSQHWSVNEYSRRAIFTGVLFSIQLFSSVLVSATSFSTKTWSFPCRFHPLTIHSHWKYTGLKIKGANVVFNGESHTDENRSNSHESYARAMKEGKKGWVMSVSLENNLGRIYRSCVTTVLNTSTCLFYFLLALPSWSQYFTSL